MFTAKRRQQLRVLDTFPSDSNPVGDQTQKTDD